MKKLMASINDSKEYILFALQFALLIITGVMVILTPLLVLIRFGFLASVAVTFIELTIANIILPN